MKLDAALLLPLFRQVKQVQDALKSYCIAGDSIPLPNDNLQYAIEQIYGISIEVRLIPFDSDLLRGSIERYSDKSIIYIDRELNSAWTRYVFAKEVCHHLLDDDEFHTLDPVGIVETIVLDESPFNETNGFAHADVQSEFLTKFAAIELLFPQEFRENCKEEVKSGNKSMYQVSEYFDIPEHLIEVALAGRYMEFSDDVWKNALNT